MEMTNKYTVGFCFQGRFEYVSFTANQMANIFIYNVSQDESILDMNSEYEQWFGEEFSRGGEKYKVTFAIGNPLKFNVYRLSEDDEFLVEENISYMLLKITRIDEHRCEKEMYNITDNL